jgi:hypothetical protein
MMDGAPKNEKITYKFSFSSENFYRAFAAAPHLPCNGKSILRQKNIKASFPSLLKA